MNLKEIFNGTTIGDRVLLIFLLLISLIGIVFIKEVLPKTKDVIIEVEGKITHRYSLNDNRLIKVEGPHGSLNVEIKDKKVRVTGASCPNKLCEHRGWITDGVIICLPGRISVIVGRPGKSKDAIVDAVTG